MKVKINELKKCFSPKISFRLKALLLSFTLHFEFHNFLISETYKSPDSKSDKLGFIRIMPDTH